MRFSFIKQFIIFFTLVIIGASNIYCQFNENDIRVAWDYSSIHQIAERGGYSRLLRLQDSSLFVIYETYTGNIHLIKSFDNGDLWTAEQEVFTKFAYASVDGKTTVMNMSNPEIIQLKNGDIIIACNYRPVQAEVAPYTIVIRRSLDNGTTWQSPQTIYIAAPRFKDGCWEPSFLQLPDGELQVYFANENPYQRSDEQEISMVSSKDNGVSWTPEATTVSFRQGKRDGMPVPVLLKDEIVVAIEDNKIKQFKPYTVRTTIPGNWATPVLANSNNRIYALKEEVADSVYMGAPYLLVLPNGQTLLSYQTNKNRTSEWELSTMEVAIGDRNAKNFQHCSRPFNLRLDQQAKWNSITLWDAKTVVALSSTDIKSKPISPWLIKGHIIPNSIEAKDEIKELSFFVGSKSNSNLKAGIAKKDNVLLVECIVSDKNTFYIDGGRAGVSIFYSSEKDKYKIWCTSEGKYQLFKEKEKKWKLVSGNVKVESQGNSRGYKLSVTIPFQSAFENIRLGMALTAFDDEGKLFTEHLAHMDEQDTGTWIRVWF